MYDKYSEYINTITEMYLSNVKKTTITAKIRNRFISFLFVGFFGFLCIRRDDTAEKLHQGKKKMRIFFTDLYFLNLQSN